MHPLLRMLPATSLLTCAGSSPDILAGDQEAHREPDRAGVPREGCHRQDSLPVPGIAGLPLAAIPSPQLSGQQVVGALHAARSGQRWPTSQEPLRWQIRVAHGNRMGVCDIVCGPFVIHSWWSLDRSRSSSSGQQELNRRAPPYGATAA